MTQIETAMAILMRTFDTYAASEGSKDTLSKAEVKILLEKELPGLLKVRTDPLGKDNCADQGGDSTETCLMRLMCTCF